MKISITKVIEWNGQFLTKTITATGKNSEAVDNKFLSRLWKSLQEKRGKKTKLGQTTTHKPKPQK